MNDRPLRFYRTVSLAMAAAFAAVGLVFIFLPDRVLEFFNRLSPALHLSPAPLHSGSFFPVLAVAYMYLVTVLSVLMFRKPGNPFLPQLLAQGKLASSIVSLLYFFARTPYLICLANALVDGCIGALVLGLFRLQKKHSGLWPT